MVNALTVTLLAFGALLIAEITEDRPAIASSVCIWIFVLWDDGMFMISVASCAASDRDRPIARALAMNCSRPRA